MGILDFFKGEPRTLTLDVATLQSWPEKLVRLQRIDKEIESFKRMVDSHRHTISAIKARLTHPSIREELDSRLQPIHDEHAPLVVDAVDDLMDEADFFGGVFLMEEQQKNFLQALETYRQRMQKSSAALKEIHGQALRTLEEHIHELEDLVLLGSAALDEKGFDSIKEIKIMVENRAQDDEKREKLIALKSQMEVKLVELKEKREKIMTKIDHYMERANDAKCQELFSKERELRRRREDIKAQELTSDQEAVNLKPIDEQLNLLRKQMLHDITALNVSEQQAFLEGVNDDLRKVKKNIIKIDAAMHETSMEQFLIRMQEHLEGFNVRVEDASTIYEDEVDVQAR